MTENNSLPIGRRPTFNALRKVYQPKLAQAAVERCDLCSIELPAEHQHLIDPQNRQILCACDACAILFSAQNGTKFKRIPKRYRVLADFQMSDADWDSLLIPVGMAYFFQNSLAGKVMAYYPSPAGATESLLDLETWDALVQANPIINEMLPDVEALLVNRLKGAREYFLAPIDKCYELVGLIRLNWKGLSG
ncbi:MAG: hypothetical protein EHM21_04875, partial [Chloroflexi bacterium]